MKDLVDIAVTVCDGKIMQVSVAGGVAGSVARGRESEGVLTCT